MIRYFISYKNLVEDTKLEMDLDLFSPELVIIKKNKDGNYRVEPILYFNGYRNDLVTYADKITESKKDVSLMVELNEEKAKKVNSLYLKKFETLNEDNKTLLKSMEEKIIRLISYNCFTNMTSKEAENGSLVLVHKSFRDKVSIKIVDKYFQLNRKNIINTGVGNDIYFYTEDLELLEKYDDEITEVVEKELNLYEIIKHKVVIIDSIPQDRVNDLNDSSLRALYELCNKSIPINLGLIDDKYSISLNKLDKVSKKGYMIIDFNIQNLICDSLLVPLLKYIHVYELRNGYYEKISIEEYMKQRDILKYIKKPK